MSEHQHLERLHTYDLELGVTDALQKHTTRHVVPPKPVSQRKLDYEHWRPRMSVIPTPIDLRPINYQMTRSHEYSTSPNLSLTFHPASENA